MYIGDLHIHSRYSRATSRDCTPEYLELWARKKGIDILGTGDFTHPAWREELKEKLEPAQDGLYVLKEEYRVRDGAAPDNMRPRFVVTGEISSIYKKQDRVRKVHSLLILPGLEEAERLARRLELIGNIHSDGRPILGLDCHDLLEIMLETCPAAIYVPAHIWTPHFSLFGAFSGFDRIEECFGDLTPQIHALETGLSSDPPMNWRISALDRYHLISNSDAHSPGKLGREANLMDIELSYAGLARAINRGEGLAGTLEFFPEEGKYHLDGHRKCGLCIEPRDTLKYGNRCPICGKKITIGVLHRVEELADREEGFCKEGALPFESLVPLPEVIAASTGGSAAGKKVMEQYGRLLQGLGPEFTILREVPVEDIRKLAGPLVAEGIRRLRNREVERKPGFDGEYGSIRLLSEADISILQGQLSLFTQEEMKEAEERRRQEKERQERARLDGSRMRNNAEREAQAGERFKTGYAGPLPELEGRDCPEQDKPLDALNAAQKEAVTAVWRAVAVIAGPGAGKTKTLVSRLLYLLEERKINPQEITALTFTNKAAEEMRSRLEKLPGGRRIARQLQIGTFHSVCSRLLTEHGIPVWIADEGLKKELAQKSLRQFGLSGTADAFLRRLSYYKNTGKMSSRNTGRGRSFSEAAEESGIPSEAFAYYQEQLRSAKAMDYEDLLLVTEELLMENRNTEERNTQAREEGAKERRKGPCNQFSYLLVDEFQDINQIQFRLIQEWSRGGKELFVIGDPDQSVYGFRGSDARCFEWLRKEYQDLHVIRLTDNYRSTPQILSGALSMISNNPGPKRQMRAIHEKGCAIRIIKAVDERNEAIYTAKEINRLIGGIDMLDVEGEGRRSAKGTRSFGDIAILYRTHRQAGLLEYCLRQEGIPYVIAGREDYLSEDSVRGALHFFRHVLHREDELSARQARNLLWQAGEEAAEGQFAFFTEKYAVSIHRAKPVRLLEEWIADWRAEEDEGLKKLAGAAVLHDSMESLLQTLSFGEDGDIRRSGGRKYRADAVTLMTFHGAKGLEFPVVFLSGVRKGLVPLETAGGPADYEEERRLFYVAMTRAREELIMTSSGEESEYAEQIPGQWLVRETAEKLRPPAEAAQMSLFDFLI